MMNQLNYYSLNTVLILLAIVIPANRYIPNVEYRTVSGIPEWMINKINFNALVSSLAVQARNGTSLRLQIAGC